MWLNKPPKFKTSTLENLTALGGLQFPNIRKIDMTMKASWIKRIYKTDEGWAATPIFYGLTKIYEYGDVFLERKNNIQNEFWKNVVQSVYFIYTNARIGSLEHVLSTPLWYNSEIIEGKIQKWLDKDIHTLGDLLDADGRMVSLEYINNILQLKCDFLLCIRLRHKLEKLLGNNQIRSQDNNRPRLPYILYIIEPGVKGNKNIYFNLKNTGNNIHLELKEKWSNKLNEDIRLDTVLNAFKNAKKFSLSVYQHFIQYKLLHRKIVHNKLLHKMGISETPNCLFCDIPETIEHIYLECVNAIQLWSKTENWIKNLGYHHFKISDIEKIFGEKHNDLLKHTVVLSIKDVIYQKRKTGKKFFLADVKRAFQKNIHILKTKDSLNQKESSFDDDWIIFIDCFRIDPATKTVGI